MKILKKAHTACVLRSAITLLILVAAFNPASAATIYWSGGTSTNWGTASNWSTNSVPGSGDAVVLGANAFTYAPIVGASTTISSLTFAANNSVTLTVNSGYTLTVSGAVTQNLSTAFYGTLTSTIAGAGSMVAASLTIGNNSTFPPVLANNLMEVVSTINSLHITGGVTINSTSYGVLFIGIGYDNAIFSLQGGTTTIDGAILTVNTASGIFPTTSATPKFSIDVPAGSALTPVLQLTSAAAINTSSVAGSIDFYNNTGGIGTCTVYYNGASQEVYTNSTGILNSSPETYQYLFLTGTGTETSDSGTLSVASNLSSSSPYFALNTNNTTATIGGNWTNTSATTQGSGNITVGGAVTNNSGGTLNLGTGNLLIAGNYTNNVGGVYSQSTGITYFNGSSGQTLVDNSTTGTTFKLVDFDGGNTATMSAGTNNVNFAVASTGILTMSNSTTLVAGSSSAAYLTLKSDTSGAATVAAIPSGCAIDGFVTAQRFVQGSATYNAATSRWIGRNYRLMSSQVNEGTDASGYHPCNINYLGASTIITDCTSSYSTTGGNPSLYLFDENYTPSNVTFTSGNFIGVTNISNTAASGQITTTDATHGSAKVYVGDGFMMFFRGDKVTHITGTPSKTSYPYVAPESVTFSTSGKLNQGTYSVVSWTETAGLMYTTSNSGNSPVRGFNLVGNPYASSIDFSTFSNTNTAAAIYGKNVNPTIYIFDPNTSNYGTYNATTGISTGAVTKIIPSGQGFFVQANAASPTLTFNESAKSSTQVTGSNLMMGTPAAETAYNSYIRLKLITDSVNNDDMVIGFNAASTSKFNPAIDAALFPASGAEQIISAISSDTVKASAKWVPFPQNANTLVVPLNVKAKATGQYTIQRTSLAAVPAIYELWLMDKYAKDSLDIKNNTTYIFNINLDDTTSFGENRFTLVVRQNLALGVHLLNFTASKTTGGSQVVWTTENEANYTNFSVERSNDGGTTYNVLGGFVSSALGTYSFLDKNPLQGADMYRLKIQDLNGNITYSNAITLTYGTPATATANTNISIYPNPSNGIINLAISQSNPTQTPGVSSIESGSTTPLITSTAKTGASSYGIKIINIMGSVIKTATSSSSNWQDNVASLTPGTYVITVVNNKDNSLVGKGMFIKM